jgi:Zn2+/Cd2+-exporting ATPase
MTGLIKSETREIPKIVLNEVQIGFIQTALALLGLLLGVLGLGLKLPWLAWTGFALNYLAGGIPASRAAIQTLTTKHKLDVDLLMVVAALGAASVGATEDGAILLFLFTLSNALQTWALNRTSSAIRALMQLRPATATIRDSSGLEHLVKLEEIKISDTLIVRPGERFAADGIVLEGFSSVDESAVTGESVPVDKSVGSGVQSGTLNDSGVLVVRVTHPAGESTLAKLIALVENAQAQKSPTELFADRLEGRYTLLVLLSLPTVFLIAHFAFNLELNAAWYKAMTFLVAVSPCAVVIATPAAMLSAMAAAARGGVLFKSGAALEALSKVRILAFDKTGTLTEGKMKLQEIIALEGSQDSALQLAASLERNSEHPVAKAIVNAYQGDYLELQNPRAVKGKGFKASLENQEIWIGNRALAAEYIVSDHLETQLENLEQQGFTTMILGMDTRTIALFAVSDTPRLQAKESIVQLQHEKLRLIMLTGDRKIVAERIASSLGILETRAELLPENKLDFIAELRKTAPIAMIGDGINDAPALALADLGIAMGSGSDVALESADVVLIKSDLGKLKQAILLARATARTVRFNLGFALSVIAVMGTLTLIGNVPLPLAVVAHEGGTVFVCLVGLRLLTWKV